MQGTSNAFWTGYGSPIFRPGKLGVTSLHWGQQSIVPYKSSLSKGATPDSNQATTNWIVPLPSEDLLGAE